MRLSSCIHQFFDKYLPQIKGVSPHTLKAYRDTFRLFLPFAADYHGIKLASLTLAHLIPELVVDFLNYLESERKNTAKTRNHRLAALKSMAKMIRFLYPDKSATADRIIRIPQKRTQRQLIGFLYPEEFDKVLDTVDIDKAQGFRDYTILQVLFDSGARASEIAQLNLDYFNPEQKTLAILGKGNRFRQVELEIETVRTLQIYIARYRKTPKPAYKKRLFISQHGKALTRHGIYRLCRKYLRLALSEKRLATLNPVHSLRHACAMNMLAEGYSLSDIRYQLGHEDIQSTMVYLQMDLSRRRKIQKKFTEHSRSVMVRNAEIEELIDKKEKEDIMAWLDSL
jgi:site-specific recombinase XerD